MQRSFSLSLCVLIILPMNIAKSQPLNIDTITKVAAVTRDTCLSGRQYDLKANADGSLSLFRLEPGVKGELRITQNNGTGGALNYQDEGKRVEADKNILECIHKNLPIFLDAAGAKLASQSSNIPSSKDPEPTSVPPTPTPPISVVAVATNKRIGIQGSIIQITSSDELRYISVIMALKNISSNVLEVTGASYDIKGTADNGQEYASTPPSFEGINECGGNNSQVCPVFIERGGIEMTEIEPGDEVRMVLKIFKSLSSHGNGPISDLLALNVPFFYRQGSSNPPPPGTARRAPRPVTLTFGRIPLVR